MHGGRADQRHRTGVVQGLLEQDRGPVEITSFKLDISSKEGGLGEGEAFELAGLDLGFKFSESAILFVGIDVGHADTEEFGLFRGSGLAGIADLDNTSDNHQDNSQGNEHLGPVLNKKLLNFRVILIRFVSHFRLPF